MKKYLFALTAILFGMFVLISCDDEEEIKGSTTFYGKVVVNPSAAKQNENVTFSIGEGGFSSDNVSVGISSAHPTNPVGSRADANPKTCCQTIHDCQKVVSLHYESEWQYKYV